MPEKKPVPPPAPGASRRPRRRAVHARDIPPRRAYLFGMSNPKTYERVTDDELAEAERLGESTVAANEWYSEHGPRLAAEVRALRGERSAVTALLDAVGHHYTDNSFPELRIDAISALAKRLAALRAPPAADTSIGARADRSEAARAAFEKSNGYAPGTIGAWNAVVRAGDASRPALTTEQAERWSCWLGVDTGYGANTWLRDALMSASRGETGPASTTESHFRTTAKEAGMPDDAVDRIVAGMLEDVPKSRRRRP